MNAAAPGLLRLPKTARFVAAKRASNDVTEPYNLSCRLGMVRLDPAAHEPAYLFQGACRVLVPAWV